MGIFTRVVTASNVNAGVKGTDKYDHGFSDNYTSRAQTRPTRRYNTLRIARTACDVRG